MRFLINLLTGDTLTQTSDTTLTDTQGNVWNKSGSTWNDSQGNFIIPLENDLYADRSGSVFKSFGGENDF